MKNPPWRTPVVVELARAVLSEKDFKTAYDLNAILADALEEAGGPERIVKHLRDWKSHTISTCPYFQWVLEENFEW